MADAPDDLGETHRVVLLNDDLTPMEFVVYVLELVFGLDREAATKTMLEVHQHGSAVVGVFSQSVAEAKAAEVLDLARRHQRPLQCVVQGA